MALAVLVEVLEELLPRQVLAALDDAREARVGDRDAVLDAALAAEAEAQRRAVDLHVPAAQRGEAEGVVLARVLVVADADQRPVEQRARRWRAPACGVRSAARRSRSMRSRSRGSTSLNSSMRRNFERSRASRYCGW